MLIIDPSIVINRFLEVLWGRILLDPGGDLIMVVLALAIAAIVAKRNHLDAKRVRSNLVQVSISVIGWVFLVLYYNRNNLLGESAFVIVAMTAVLGGMVILGVLIAAAVRHYSPAPGSLLRADVARFLCKVAEHIADKKYYSEQHATAQQLINSLNVVEHVLALRKQDKFEIVPEIVAKGIG
jgi:hypothetical protein